MVRNGYGANTYGTKWGSPVLGDPNTGIPLSSIVNNTGIQFYTSIVNFFKNKYNTGINY